MGANPRRRAAARRRKVLCTGSGQPPIPVAFVSVGATERGFGCSECRYRLPNDRASGVTPDHRPVVTGTGGRALNAERPPQP